MILFCFKVASLPFLVLRSPPPLMLSVKKKTSSGNYSPCYSPGVVATQGYIRLQFLSKCAWFSHIVSATSAILNHGGSSFLASLATMYGQSAKEHHDRAPWWGFKQETSLVIQIVSFLFLSQLQWEFLQLPLHHANTLLYVTVRNGKSS